MASKNAAAISAATDLIGLIAALKGLRPLINDFVTRYNNESYSTTWSNMPTAAENSDKSLGLID